MKKGYNIFLVVKKSTFAKLCLRLSETRTFSDMVGFFGGNCGIDR